MENNESIKQLLIIGNGFDLACGLKSSYKDFFYDLYIDNPTKYRLTNTDNYWFLIFRTFLRTYSSYIPYWTDIESQILEELINIDFLINHNLISSLNSKINFSTIKSEISKYVNSMSTSFHSYNTDSILQTYLTLNKCFEQHYFIDANSILKQLKNDLMKLESDFILYLNCELERCNNKYSLRSDLLLNKLQNQRLSYIRPRRHRQSSHSNMSSVKSREIISFNYTQPKVKSSIRNIHGNLNDKNIIFGIDYDNIFSQFKKHPIEFTKSFRILENKLDSNVSISSDIKYVLFYGHALGEADYSYFQSIFDTVDLYHSETELVFYWTQFGMKNQYNIQVEKVTSLIEKYGKTFSNKDHGRNLFTKLLLENRIHFKEIKPYEVWKMR